jgi:hypothetical protein
VIHDPVIGKPEEDAQRSDDEKTSASKKTLGNVLVTGSSAQHEDADAQQWQ